MCKDDIQLKICGIQTECSADAENREKQKVSDLAYPAVEKLIKGLKWKKDEIRCLFLVTGTSDYLIPSTASLLHKRLEIGHNCLTWDINVGEKGPSGVLFVAESMLRKLEENSKGIVVFSDLRTDIAKQKAVAVGVCLVEKEQGMYCGTGTTNEVYVDLPEIYE